MDQTLLEEIVAELEAHLLGARIDRIVQTEQKDICLCLYQGRSRPVLLLSPDRGLPRMHLLTERPAGSRTVSPFVLFLRKHLHRARLDGIGTVNHDRVVALKLSCAARPMQLIFELTGGSANLILVDEGGAVRAVLHEHLPDGGKGRVLLPGSRYRPPDKGGAPSRPERCRSLLPTVDTVGAMPVNRAAAALFERLLEQRAIDMLRRTIHTACQRALLRAERRIVAITEDLARAERSEQYQAAGSLILANLQKLSKGLTRAELLDHTGRAVEVLLDPTRTPTENAEAYFRRSKKAKASRVPAQERLDDTYEEADLLRLAMEDVGQAQDRRALDSIKARLLRYGLIREPRAGRFRRSAVSMPSVRAVQFEGWDILIGKSAASNDHITQDLARPDDLWLHAEGMPGSHVLVRNPGRRDIPSAVLKRAAALAAYFSKGKGSAKVPVAYTTARYVSKPKGAKPGFVVLSKRKTIMVAPGPL